MELFLYFNTPFVIGITVVLVILTSFSFIIRRSIYIHLYTSSIKIKRLVDGTNEGKQSKMLLKLKERFVSASQYIERVNTSALIDELYGEEYFNCFGIRLKCVKWDYFSNITPNLLLTIGLLGTFAGITLNLSNLTDLISQNNTAEIDIINQLQSPLRNMGLAFITSLIALFLSSILTLANSHWNTNISRIYFLSSLESYLDNVLQPTIDGRSRLDKSVDRMVEQQREFLLRFHQNVTKAIESSLGQVSVQIATGNKEAADLAKEVYLNFAEASGSLSNSTLYLSDTALNLKEEISILQNLVQQENFVAYVDQFSTSSQALNNAISKITESNMLKTFEDATMSLQLSHIDFSQSVNTLQECCQLLKGFCVDQKDMLSTHKDLQLCLSNILDQQNLNYQTNHSLLNKLTDSVLNEELKNVCENLYTAVNHINNNLEQISSRDKINDILDDMETDIATQNEL